MIASQKHNFIGGRLRLYVADWLTLYVGDQWSSVQCASWGIYWWCDDLTLLLGGVCPRSATAAVAVCFGWRPTENDDWFHRMNRIPLDAAAAAARRTGCGVHVTRVWVYLFNYHLGVCVCAWLYVQLHCNCCSFTSLWLSVWTSSVGHTMMIVSHYVQKKKGL